MKPKIMDRSMPRRGGAVLLLGLAGLVTHACRSNGDEAGDNGPGDDGAAQAAVEEQGNDPALTALADTLLPGLERLSKLEAVRPVVVERRSPEQVRAFVEQQLDERLPADELRGFQDAYALLGLIPDTLDLRALMLDLYTEQIVGYYDPEAKKLFVVEGVPREAVRPVLAHELVHALQDQHTSLDSLIAPERGNDRQLAAQAAIEGHATLVMFALLTEQSANRPVDPATLPNLADQFQPALEASSDFPVFRSAPRIVRETLLFSYSGGARFVQELWRAQGESREAPIDSLLPQSTEQVLEPVLRFIDERDAPTELRFDDGGGADAGVYENGLGQLEIELFLEEHLGADARSAAQGWDGDRYRLLRSPDGARTLIWYSIWDDAASADRFHARLNEVLAGPLGGNGTAERVAIDDRPGVRAIIGNAAAPADMPLPVVRTVEG